jgi:hypothetical protein
MTDFPITPESLTRETLQAVTLLRELEELTPGCLAVRRSHLEQIEAKLQTLRTLLTAPSPSTVAHTMLPLVQAIQAELDRIGWSSDTAPRGPHCLTAFPTHVAGLVTLANFCTTITLHGGALLAILQALPEETAWEDLCIALRPALADQ